jgi:hypothetical protein
LFQLCLILFDEQLSASLRRDGAHFHGHLALEAPESNGG